MRLQFVGIIDLIFYNKLRLLVRQNYGKITSFYLKPQWSNNSQENCSLGLLDNFFISICFKLVLTEYLYLYL